MNNDQNPEPEAILSFFVLGGEFWDKVRSLFVYRATARFLEKTHKNNL